MKRLYKWIEAINAYYAFALLVYAAALFIAGHTKLFYLVFFATTPLLGGWSGYLLNDCLARRNQRHGFRTVSDRMTYEMHEHGRYTLRFTTRLKACRDHLMSYPIGYQWTGSGKETEPTLSNPGQSLLAPAVAHQSKRTGTAPHKVTDSTEGDWNYWFVSFNPPVHKGETVEVKYAQEFTDYKGTAKPCVYYFVRTPMKRLQLNVRFNSADLPKEVTGSIIRPADRSRPYAARGVVYEPDKGWATWVIDSPKKGHCYRISW